MVQAGSPRICPGGGMTKGCFPQGLAPAQKSNVKTVPPPVPSCPTHGEWERRVRFRLIRKKKKKNKVVTCKIRAPSLNVQLLCDDNHHSVITSCITKFYPLATENRICPLRAWSQLSLLVCYFPPSNWKKLVTDVVDSVNLKSKNLLLEKWLLPYKVGSGPEHWKSQKQLTEVKCQHCSSIMRPEHIKALVNINPVFSFKH